MFPASGNFGGNWGYDITDASGTSYTIMQDRNNNYYYLNNNQWIPYQDEYQKASRQMTQLVNATGTGVFATAVAIASVPFIVEAAPYISQGAGYAGNATLNLARTYGPQALNYLSRAYWTKISSCFSKFCISRNF